MKNNPYIGPRPYERTDRRNFYGRAREARDLLALIRAERAVLFYAQSGAGKTSLLNAQIIPALEEDGFYVLPVARVGSDAPPGIDPKSVPNIFVLSALMGLVGERASASLLGHSLHSFLSELVSASGGEGAKLPILILDQFEEILTTHRDRWQDAQGFFEQLRDALREMPTLGVVLAMREDHLAELDPYAALLPKRLRIRFRMGLLGREGALEAVRWPARAAGCPFDEGVAERLVDDLSRIRVQRHGDAAQAEAQVIGPTVEPVQLQVVCQRLWENLPDSASADSVIQWEEVSQFGDIDRALTDFYESALSLASAQGVSERQLRRWFSEQLITPVGTRGLALRERDRTAGLPNEVVDLLENRHLIRADVRAGSTWHELAHDRLVEPILQSNRAWEAARQTPLRATARQWQQTKNIGLFYRDKALKEALAWAQANPNEVEPYETEFLKASQEAEQIRARTRTLTMVGVTATVLIAVAMAYLAWTATQARQVAEQQRRMALSRQLAAQTLTYLNDRLDLALLLSLQANRITDNVEAKGSLLSALTASPKLATFLHGHTAGVTSVSISPDGRTLASADANGPILLWDMETRQPLGPPLVGHSGPVNSLSFSPAGQMLASGSDDKTIVLWQLVNRAGHVDTQAVISHTLMGHTMTVRSVAFSPDGKLLASGSADKSILLWDVATRQPVAPPMTGHTADVFSVAFSPDGRRLASGSCARVESFVCRQGEILVWDVATRKPLSPPIASGHTDLVSSVAFSPDGRLLASGSRDKTIIVWDAATLMPSEKPLTGHTDYVNVVAFRPDGQELASGSDDGTIILWDIATRQSVDRPLKGHASGVKGLAFAPDGKKLVSGSSDTAIILWDVTARQSLGETLARFTNQVWGMALSHDGQTLAAGSCSQLIEDRCQRGEISLWDIATRQPIGAPLAGHTSWVTSVAFDPSGRTLASASWDGTIILWDLTTSKPFSQTLTGHKGLVLSVAFSPDGKLLASGDSDGAIILWDLTTGKPLSQTLTGHVTGVLDLKFSPDGRILASGSCAKIDEKIVCHQGEIRLWDATSRQLIGALIGHTNWVMSLAFSPDGKTLASGSADGAIILWNVAARQPSGPPLVGHTNWLRSVAFSPDGQVLASGGDDKAILLWDVASRRRLGPPLVGHDERVNTVIFSSQAGGRTLVSASDDKTIALWDVSFESWEARACREANRNMTLAEWTEFVDHDPETYARTCPDLPPGENASPGTMITAR